MEGLDASEMNMDPGARIAFLHSLNQAMKNIQITERGTATKKMLEAVTLSLIEAAQSMNMAVDNESDSSTRLLFLGGALGLLEAAKSFHRILAQMDGE